MGGVLALVLSGESEYRRQGRFAGLKNPNLTQRGIKEATEAGAALSDLGLCFDAAFTSKLKRAQQSLALILKQNRHNDVPLFEAAALNARNYGDLAGLTAETAQRRWGEARVAIWRSSYREIPPSGESLSMTADRTRLLFEKSILPLLKQSKTVLVVAHRSSLLTIVMFLDKIAYEQVIEINLPSAGALLYRFDIIGQVIDRSDSLGLALTTS
jgi:2,3-bisphosphoglycerate-dependent phosphoglycerate mutase